MLVPSLKRQAADITGDSDSDRGSATTNPKAAKMRKTTATEARRSCDRHSPAPSPDTAGRGSDPEQSGVALLAKHQDDLYHLHKKIYDYDEHEQELTHENAGLRRKLAEAQASLAAANEENKSLRRDLATTLQRHLPGSDPASKHIQAEWQALRAGLAKLVRAHLVLGTFAGAYPSSPQQAQGRQQQQHDRLFARLARDPGALLEQDGTRSLLFQAWFWDFLQTRVFSSEQRRRCSTTTATTTTSSPSSSSFLDGVSPRKGPGPDPEQVHAWAMEMFGFFAHEIGCAVDDVRGLLGDLKAVLWRAAQLDVVLRRSGGRPGFATELPCAGVFGRDRRFDGETMKPTWYVGPVREVALVVAPMVLRRWGDAGGWDADDDDSDEEVDGVLINSLVVLGEKEGEEDFGALVRVVEETEKPNVKREDSAEVEMKEEATAG